MYILDFILVDEISVNLPASRIMLKFIGTDDPLCELPHISIASLSDQRLIFEYFSRQLPAILVLHWSKKYLFTVNNLSDYIEFYMANDTFSRLPLVNLAVDRSEIICRGILESIIAEFLQGVATAALRSFTFKIMARSLQLAYSRTFVGYPLSPGYTSKLIRFYLEMFLGCLSFQLLSGNVFGVLLLSVCTSEAHHAPSGNVSRDLPYL